MAVVKFYSKIKDEQLSFAVIISKMNGKWVLCKHRDRVTLEFPGGHREIGESILETAKRELKEETGAEDFNIKFISYYSVRGNIREGETLENEFFGALFTAEIKTISDNLHNEIEKVFLLDELLENMTYPDVVSKLIKKIQDSNL